MTTSVARLMANHSGSRFHKKPWSPRATMDFGIGMPKDDGDGDADVDDVLAIINGFGTKYDVDDLLNTIADFGCQG